MELKFKRLNSRAELPRKAHATDAGLDLTVNSFSMDHKANTIQYGFGLAVEIWYENRQIANYERSFGKGHTAYRLEHYIELISRRPRSVWNAKPVRSTVPAQLLRFLEKLDDPKQVVTILRSYIVSPERVMHTVAACGDYNQAILELNTIPYRNPDNQQDIPVCRTDLSQYDRLLGRRDAV